MDLELLKRELLYRREALQYRLGRRPTDGSIPHARKRSLIAHYRRRYGLRSCVETGTYLGDMTAVLARQFEEVHSIELSRELHERARRRFRAHGHVHLHQGDSGRVLARVVSELTRPALFWLDAHYSGGITARGIEDSPIAAELDAVFGDGRLAHVALIDDARCFNGSGGYPTLPALRERVAQRAPAYHFQVADDVIRLTPPEALR